MLRCIRRQKGCHNDTPLPRRKQVILFLARGTRGSRAPSSLADDRKMADVGNTARLRFARLLFAGFGGSASIVQCFYAPFFLILAWCLIFIKHIFRSEQLTECLHSPTFFFRFITTLIYISPTFIFYRLFFLAYCFYTILGSVFFFFLLFLS